MSTDIFSLKLGLDSCYLIRSKNTVMIDGGVPNKLDAFKRKLNRLHIHPEEIRLIILTHSHFDHAGSAKEIRDYTGAKILIHEKECIYLESGEMCMPKGVKTWGKINRLLLFPFLRRIKFPLFKPDIIMKGEEYSLDEFGIDGKVIHTPGHTPGSVSVLLKTGEAFVGCMAHDGFPFRTNPGLPIFASDIDEIKRSWKSLIERGAKIVFPGHGNRFSIEVIKQVI